MVLVGIFDFVSRRYEGTEMGSGGKDEPIDIIFLEILDFFLLPENRVGVFDLLNADDIGLSK